MKRVYIIVLATIIAILSVSCSKKTDENLISSNSDLISQIDTDSNLSSDAAQSEKPSSVSSNKNNAASVTSISSKIPNSPKPLVFDDPVLEKIIRKLTKKATGNVYPGDLEFLTTKSMYFVNQGFNGYTFIADSLNEYHSGEEGIVKSYQALSTVPFKTAMISYFPSDKLENYTIDLKWITDSGALEYLFVPGSEKKSVTIKNFDSIANCKNLKDIKFNNCQDFNLKALAGLKNLESIEFQNCDITSIEGLRDLPKLKSINLYDNPEIDLSPLKGKSSIEKIMLSNISNPDIEILLSLPNLRTLDLDNCPPLDYETILKFREKGTKVTESKNGWIYY